MSVEAPTSTLSQSLVTQSLLANMEQQEPKKAAQYDSVKMRYFLSLGMNRPPPQLSASVPTHSYMSNVASLATSPRATNPNMIIPSKSATRQRTKTAPSPASGDENSDGEFRKRTTSVPIPIGFTTETPAMAVSVGTYLNNPVSSFDSSDDESDPQTPEDRSGSFFNPTPVVPKNDSEDDLFGNYEEFNQADERANARIIQDSPVKFIPPHEMMANNKKDFNVGTAHSVAVWEQRRRKFI